MSFSSQIKEKLCSLEHSCSSCAAAETAGLLRFGGFVNTKEVRFTTENRQIALRLCKNLDDAFGIYAILVAGNKSTILNIDNPNDMEKLFTRFFNDKFTKQCCINSYIRGAFLGGGSISDPEKGYHLEFATKNKGEANFLKTLLQNHSFNAKIANRKSYVVVYIKECEQIADLLELMGDASDALEMFSVQIEKEMRNNINRKVNCENANADKTAKATSKHLFAINKIKTVGKWNTLPDTLQQIGQLREEYPEDSLKALGERLNPPIGKSGVNHRLNRIIEIAEELE